MGTGTGTAARWRGHGALALWLVVLVFLAPVLGAAKMGSAGQLAAFTPALFAVPLLALGALCAAHVGRSVLAHRVPGVQE